MAPAPCSEEPGKFFLLDLLAMRAELHFSRRTGRVRFESSVTGAQAPAYYQGVLPGRVCLACLNATCHKSAKFVSRSG